MAKAKVKPKKAPIKAAKPAKPAEKASGKTKLAAASKAKPATKAVTPKPQPAAAKAKSNSSVEVKKDNKASAKTTKAPKKEAKAKKAEELDLFDDGDVTESEELLEYQEDLEVADEIEESASDLDDTLLESAAVTASTESEEDIVLTDAEGNRYCRAKDCDQISIVESYCRYHYLLFWKKIQIRKEILQDGKLEKYVDDLTSRYPDKFLEMLRKDLRTTKDFLAAIAELEIDESAGENEFEEDAQTFIDEVRGISADSGTTMEDDDAF